MTQKWNVHPSDVFNGFTNSTTAQSSHIENGTTLTMPSVGQGSNQMHIAPQSHMLHHVGNSNSFIVPISNDLLKSTCIRSADCNDPQNNEFLNHLPATSSNQQVSELIQTTQSEPSISQPCLNCFVCSSSIEEKNYSPIKSSMNHSGAPCLVLLSDVLGYKLDNSKLHSQVVCKECVHLLDIIDELQQTLTESKTDVRTKFLDTVQRLKLKYPRTDKMLRPRCLRCVQMAQSNSKKRLRGRNVRGRVADEEARIISKPCLPTELWDANVQSIENTPATDEADSEIDVDNNETGTDDNAPNNLAEPSNKDSNVIFDNDPAFFSTDEKLKVGIAKELEGVKVFLCIYCNVRYDTAFSLKMHVRAFHMPILVYDNGQGTPATKYRMGIKLQHASPTGLPTSEKPFACLFCESAYKLQSSLQSHFRDNHSPHKPFQCLECKLNFRRPIELSRHRLYRCPAKKSQMLSSKR